MYVQRLRGLRDHAANRETVRTETILLLYRGQEVTERLGAKAARSAALKS
jgi:hypothetical protein